MTEIEIGRRERKKEETRQRIFQAAIELFRKKGFDATTVDDITEQADVAKGTFFNYYPRKESVLFDVNFEHLADVEDFGRKLGDPQRSATEHLIDVLAHGARLYTVDRDLSRAALLQLFRGANAPGPEAAEIDRRAQDMIRSFVERAQAAGDLRRDVDADRAGYVLRSIFFFTVLLWVCSPEPPFELEQELTGRVRLAIEGMAAHAGGAL